MRRTDVAIVGAGQAGLAMSACLSARGIDHVVLERGRVAEAWRSARWDSLRLLTPNWMSRLPGHRYDGPDPDGFMDRAAVVGLLAGYAARCEAPVLEMTRVHAVGRAGAGYLVETDRGGLRARAVVAATGASGRAHRPAFASELPGDILQLDPTSYRCPDDLPAGGVLVVGGSSSGLQLAQEIQASGRPVTLAVGRHTRMLRRYRGRDIFAWLEAAGITRETWRQAPDLAAARRQPSMQLSSSGPIDLALLATSGVRVVGRVEAASGARLALGDRLAADCAASDARLARVLRRIDDHVAAAGLDAPADPDARIPPSHPASDATRLDLRAEGIRSVVWATGFVRDHGWLGVPVRDAAGEIVHAGGVTAAPGLVVLGQRFQCHRASNFIDGVGRDADGLARHLAGFLGARLAA
jgi:putative flavoprotein involved in K+ transport